MSISCFDLFKIGIGPSSSHTVGPMKAARLFLSAVSDLALVDNVQVELFGSLGATGKGHGSDKAVVLGLMGHAPATVDVDAVDGWMQDLADTGRLLLDGKQDIRFVLSEHLLFTHKQRPGHPNALHLIARDKQKTVLHEATFYSIGGGFVLDEQELKESKEQAAAGVDLDEALPFPFRSADELVAHCAAADISISALMWQNELVARTQAEIESGLDAIWQCMVDCIKRGCQQRGQLPGFLKVKRRAADLYQRLNDDAEFAQADPLVGMDWINCYALAVNEENAAGSRVVTAPTNGAAGIIPAVMRYFERCNRRAPQDWHRTFLLTASAIGILYQKNASISGADVGCQGEVGVACSMAAGALCEVMGGSPQQVENAAEIGMEHNLGLTCDPVGGLVQVPCIERNAMAAVKAVNAARMALRGNGSHYVSLDKVIKTMRDTGADMKKKYKETARGGLAVNIIEC